MSEMALQMIGIAKLGLITIFSSLYAVGGIDGKWIRRYLAPFVLAGGLIMLSFLTDSFSWWILLWYALLTASLHMGYGAT